MLPDCTVSIQVPFVGHHFQTNSIDRYQMLATVHRMIRLIKTCIVCLQKFLAKIQWKEKNHQTPPKLEIESPTSKIRVNWRPTM